MLGSYLICWWFRENLTNAWIIFSGSCEDSGCWLQQSQRCLDQHSAARAPSIQFCADPACWLPPTLSSSSYLSSSSSTTISSSISPTSTFGSSSSSHYMRSIHLSTVGSAPKLLSGIQDKLLMQVSQSKKSSSSYSEKSHSKKSSSLSQQWMSW